MQHDVRTPIHPRCLRCAPIAVALALLVLAGCGSEEPRAGSFAAPANAEAPAVPAPRAAQANRPPVVESLSIEPTEPLPGERVTAQVQVQDPDGDRVEIRYQWWLDGQAVPEPGSSILVQGSRGSRVVLAVTASDGRATSEPVRREAQVGNRRPIVEAVLLEPAPEVTVESSVSAAPRVLDPDGDPVDLAYEWRVNGQLVHREGPTLSPEHFRRGDAIELTVVASDGDEESEALRSDPIRVANAAPTITSVPGDFGEDGSFRYGVEVADPDGDRLFRFRLEEAPAGMRIDPVDGRLQWTPTEEQAGLHRVAIAVDDRRGGSASQRFEIELAFEDVPVDPVPAAPAE